MPTVGEIRQFRNRVISEVQSQGFIFTSLSSQNFIEFSRSLGTIVTPRFADPEIQELTPRDITDSHPNSLSSRYGFGEFPYHTDCAHFPETPRFVCLYSPEADLTHTPTRLLTLKYSPELRSAVFQEIRVFESGRKSFPSPIVSFDGDNFAVRFDPGCMNQSKIADSEKKIVVDKFLSIGRLHEFYWKTDSLLVFDNRKCLHARAELKSKGFRKLMRSLIK